MSLWMGLWGLLGAVILEFFDMQRLIRQDIKLPPERRFWTAYAIATFIRFAIGFSGGLVASYSSQGNGPLLGLLAGLCSVRLGVDDLGRRVVQRVSAPRTKESSKSAVAP